MCLSFSLNIIWPTIWFGKTKVKENLVKLEANSYKKIGGGGTAVLAKKRRITENAATL